MDRKDVVKVLKSKGYSDHDIHLIIPIAERLQEKFQDQGDGEISPEALVQAEKYYGEQYTSPRPENILSREPKKDSLGYKSFLRFGLIIFILTVAFSSWYLFQVDFNKPPVVKDYRKGLYIPERRSGEVFHYRVKVYRGTKDQPIESYKESFKVSNVTKSEIEWMVLRDSSHSPAKIWTYRNPFMLPLKSENYTPEDISLVRYTGDVDSIFPLKIGSFYQAKVYRKSELLGESQFEVECKVEDQGVHSGHLGNLDFLLINCYKKPQKELFRQYQYAPQLGHFTQFATYDRLEGHLIIKEASLQDLENVVSFDKPQ